MPGISSCALGCSYIAESKLYQMCLTLPLQKYLERCKHALGTSLSIAGTQLITITFLNRIQKPIHARFAAAVLPEISLCSMYRKGSSGSKASVSAHTGEVKGLCSDARNHVLVSAGRDGWLRMWDFKRQLLKAEVDVGVSVTKIASHPGSALVATAATDNVLRM